ncbi:MAG: 4Fe-4S dicluster domain-containing protein [Desulfobacter sp.]|nr:MAG: 4Fe-4S dicluster domain-containing protein [Desulfobacter sp.]
MINNLFFGYAALRLNYTGLEDNRPEPVALSLPGEVSLLAGCTPDQALLVAKKKTLLKKGEDVRTGQRLRLFETEDVFLLSTVTGTVSGVGLYTGPLGRKLVRVNIVPGKEEVTDDGLFDTDNLDPASAHKFISQLPGRMRLLPLQGDLPPINELVVCAGEKDISVVSNQYALKHDGRRVADGIELLKRVSGVKKVTLAVPGDLAPCAGGMGARVLSLSRQYPAASPRLIAKEILGRAVPAAKPLAREGLAFISTETAAALGRIAQREAGVFDKTLSLVLKNGTSILVKVRIGTPISHILSLFNQSLVEGDYLIGGGPLTGVAIHDPDYTISPYMDGILVCAGEDILENGDYGCINCGKCVRVCPARVPVNLLVRHLTRGDYLKASDHFNLDSCLECGLCTYACVSKIPILQRIKLGKMKLRAMKQEVIDGGRAQ